MKLKKESTLSKESFISGWYIPKKVCNDLIHYFKKHNELGNIQKGAIKFSNKNKTDVNSNIKDSYDLVISPFNKDPEILTYIKYLSLCLNDYIKKYPDTEFLDKFGLTQTINIQYYKKGGGYKRFHSERGSKGIEAKRVLVFMTYLNDVEDGGTEFKYQNLITPAKKGLTVIWPSEWMHTHRSQVSFTKDKYIITGWFNYID